MIRHGAIRTDTETANPAAAAIVRNILTLRPGSALISFKTGFESLLSAVLVIAKPLILTVISVNCRARRNLGWRISNCEFFLRDWVVDLMVSAHQRHHTLAT